MHEKVKKTGWCPIHLHVQLNSPLYTDSRSIGRPTGHKATNGAAEHDLAAHFGCDDDEGLYDAIIRFTDHGSLEGDGGVIKSEVCHTKPDIFATPET